jgi:glutathione synthase/RimK-type ligase-like ATP-grasp enzyme
MHVDLVALEDFPDRLRVNAVISNAAALHVAAVNDHGPVSLTDPAVVWNRRAGKFSLSKSLSALDVNVVSSTVKDFLNSVRLLSSPHQIWVNDRLSQIQVENKLFQLEIARQCGLAIPATLVSNSLDDVAAFEKRAGALICKPIYPMAWSRTGGISFVPTANLPPTASMNAEQVALCPMIYQERVEKAYELRIVLFGSELVAVRLDSQSDSGTATDSRLKDPKHLQVEEVEIPPELRAKLIDFARRSNVLHGSFDFAVSPGGDYIFFEFNEQGQSLWIEDCNPSIRILDRFVAFFSSASADFIWDGTQGYAFGDFPDSV